MVEGAGACDENPCGCVWGAAGAGGDEERRPEATSPEEAGVTSAAVGSIWARIGDRGGERDDERNVNCGTEAAAAGAGEAGASLLVGSRGKAASPESEWYASGVTSP